MYFRMLKKDLKDKIGLNITLFLFMILASAFVMVSIFLLYTKLNGSNRTYERCNTSDLFITVEQSIGDNEEQRNFIESKLEAIPELEEFYVTERIGSMGNLIDYENVEETDSMVLLYYNYLFTDMPVEHNVPYNMEGETFTVSNGCVAVPQNLVNATQSEVGDHIRITTQMGNVYEFTISTIYKDPSAESYIRLIFSDADYAALFAESPVKMDFFEVYFQEFKGDNVQHLLDIGANILTELEDIGATCYCTKVLFLSNDGIVSLTVSFVMAIVSIFLIAMIFITIHFSLKSAIKREEKEIGMMKAIGVYSFTYRALFAVKYIAFALVGGVIAIPIALPLGNALMNTFMMNTLLPTKFVMVQLTLIGVGVTVLIIIGFTFLALRRMKKITVMDAIHGENKGERFRKVPGLFLHCLKRCNVPWYLAVNDILGGAKRYIYLILAYITGVSLVLLVIQIKDSFITMDYPRNYWQQGEMDFYMVVNDAYYSKLYESAGSGQGVFNKINRNFEEHGIPAKAEYYHRESVKVNLDGKICAFIMKFGIEETDDIRFIEGGTPPQLPNEIAMQYYNAKLLGIEIGDVVTVIYDKYNDDHVSSSEVSEDFIVTAFYDGFGVSVPEMIMGEEFTGAVTETLDDFQFTLTCEPEEYDRYFAQMQALYAEDEIQFIPKDEVLNYMMGSFNTMFTLMLQVVCTIVAIVLVLMTVLYQNTFIEEETQDVAVLKSMGLDSKPIKLWQYIRILLLLLFSIIMAHLLVVSIGNYAISLLVAAILRIVDFRMAVRFWANFVLVPLSVCTLLFLVLIPTIRVINNIQIWRIRNE